MGEQILSAYIITGASSGIGEAVAVALGRRDKRVFAVARSVGKLRALAAEFRSVVAVPADLATSEGIAAVSEALEGVAAVSGIVHGAGSLVPLEPFPAMEWSELTEHFRLHVGAPIALYQSVASVAPVERMVFIDSYSATTPRDGWPAYSIVKSAAQMAARAAALELTDTAAIRIFPGAVDTPILQAVLASDAPAAATYAAMVERGEVATPAEVADFITAILVDAPGELLAAKEAWDYNDAADRGTVAGLISR